MCSGEVSCCESHVMCILFDTGDVCRAKKTNVLQPGSRFPCKLLTARLPTLGQGARFTSPLLTTILTSAVEMWGRLYTPATLASFVEGGR